MNALLQAAIERDLLPPGRFLVALSGGADSVALLLSLHRLPARHGITLAAAHLNHGLRGDESDGDERFVRALCDRLGVSLTVERADVAAEAAGRRQGIELAARELRYAFLTRAAREQGCDFIATAHTADDQAETVLLRMARGTGLRGLAGIPERRGNILRPFLRVRRAEIEAWLAEQGEPFRTDSTNLDPSYARNRVRHQVLPALKTLNPNLLAAIQSLSDRAAEDDACLTALASAELEHAGAECSAARLAALRPAIGSRAVRILYGRVSGAMLSQEQIASVLRLAAGKDPSARISLPDGVTARRRYDALLLERSTTRPPPSAVPLTWGETRYGGYRVWMERCAVPEDARPADLYLDLSCADRLTLRPRREGDRLSPLGRSWTKSIRKIMIERKIPAEERSEIPIVACDGVACAMDGIGADRAFAASEGEAIRLKFQKEREICGGIGYDKRD